MSPNPSHQFRVCMMMVPENSSLLVLAFPNEEKWLKLLFSARKQSLMISKDFTTSLSFPEI